MEKYLGQISGLASPLLETIRIKKIINLVNGGDILDYGCGNGKFSEVLSYKKYTGVDLDITILSYAKKKYSHLKNISFYTNEEFELNYECFDCVILSAVIEHFKNPVEELKMLKKHLKPNGKIIIITPTRLGNVLLNYGSKIGIFSRRAFEEHNQIFSKSDFINIAQILKFKIVKYSIFEFGMNQLVELSREDRF